MFALPFSRRALLPTLAVFAGLTFTTTARAEAACDAVAGNLVQNCGFEQGGAFWNTGAIGLSGGPFYAHSGSVGLAGGAVGALGHWTQQIATTPGQTYTVSFWYNSTGAFTNALFASFAGQTGVNAMNLPAQGWTQYSFDATAFDGVSTLDLGMRNDPTWDGLDDVSVTAASTVTPEPGTWALLGAGLAAIGAAARRRRPS